MERSGLANSNLESMNEENRANQLRDEVLSSTKENPFQFGSQQETDERKSRAALAYVIHNYGGLQESELSSPFLIYTKGTDSSIFATKRKDLAREIAAFENAAQAVSYSENRENNFKRSIGKHGEETGLITEEPSEKSKEEDPFYDEGASNGKQERESYWERRRKNNASAKKSRDARKARELQTQIRAAFLERENLRILAQLMIVQKENACLKRVLCAKMS